jgi:toxin YhaV
MEVNGWRLFTHPLLDAQLKRLLAQVEDLKPEEAAEHPAAKLLATINNYIAKLIPNDPNSPEFRLGNTLGKENRHWFRAKFHELYRLFFRFSRQQKVIVYAWVNDETTLRKRDSKTNPYELFRSMLKRGSPPDSFEDLLKASEEFPTKQK